MKGILNLMELANVPLTVDNFLTFLFLGQVPNVEEIDGELLAEMPEWFAKQIEIRQRKQRAS